MPRAEKVAVRAWRGIGLRLAVWYGAVTLASYLALAVMLPLVIRTWNDDEGQRSTESALGRYKDVLETGGTDALRAMFDCHDDVRQSVGVRLTDHENVELLRATSDEASSRVASELTDRTTGRLTAARAPEGWHVAAISVSQGRQLEVLLHDDTALVRWRHARDASLVILGCGLVSAIVGAFVITRRALRPIGDLALATQEIIDSGNLARRVETRGTTDSLDRLGALFNRMLARNEAQVRAMRESLDNVAHDLRTPLTRLRAGAELALRDGGDEAGAKEALAEAIEESDRVLAMLTTLMDITEAETGVMRLDKHDEDLASIAREAIDLYDLVAADRGVHIVSRLDPGVMVSVDRARIRQVAANLIDNAVKYTAPGGRVEVAVTRDDAAGIFTISDTGIGISASDIPRVWGRLYRGDRSRSERGIGLGLSLVKAVVEAHGGTVSIESEVGAGSKFEVRLARPVH